MLPFTTSPISWATIPVMVWTGSNIVPTPFVKSGILIRLPAQRRTTIVSPITRPKPKRIADTIPDNAQGKMTLKIVCNRLPPSAKEASLKDLGTLFKASSHKVKMVGMAIKANNPPAVKAFKRSLIGKKGTQDKKSIPEKSRRNFPNTAIPKKPMTTDGMAEINSMYGLIKFCSLRLASWFT